MAKKDDGENKIQQTSHGSNSPNIVGDNARIYYEAPERNLSLTEQNAIADYLSRSSATVSLMSKDGDQEAYFFANQIDHILRMAGWTIVHRCYVVTPELGPLWVGVNSPDDRIGRSLQDAFRIVGIQMTCPRCSYQS